MIILTGILLSEFFKRSGNQRKGVLVYSFFSALFGLAVLHDMYRYFLTSYNAISLVIYFSFYVLLVGLFMWNSIRYWKLINKTLFFLAFLFGTLAMAFFFLRFYFDISEIWNLVFWETSGYCVYFFIIKFLIDTSVNKK